MPADDNAQFREIELSGWNRLAEHYDRFAGSFTVQAVEPLLDAVGAGPETRLLDVACGTGSLAAAAVRRGAAAIGIDFAAEMVERARVAHPGVRFEEGDAEALDFPDGCMDAVTCGFGLLHLADPDRAIREAFRVLAGGGRYAFTVWCPPEKTQFFGLVMDAIRAHGRMDVPVPPAPPMFRFADPAACRESLTAAGFAGPNVREIELVWSPGSAAEVLDYCTRSSVRLPILLDPQTPEARAAIERAVLAGAERFRTATGYRILWPAVLAVATKP